MNLELLIPFITVAYTMWATPGPNNMMLAYSGARFGVWASFPHILGIVTGTLILNVMAIMGLKPLLDAWPQLLLVLKIVGSVWLLVIGWKMANAGVLSGKDDQKKPMSFFAAVLFQFANPKAISATLALVSLVLVVLETKPELIWIVIMIISPLCLIAIIPWVLAGRAIRQFLSTPLRWRIFTLATGGLTAACAVFLWI